MKIGVLTGGGDVPGLNACIKAVVTRAAAEGHQVLGIRRGWAGLLEVDLTNPLSVSVNTIPLDVSNVRTIDRTGGTFLHTSRTNPARVKPEDEPTFLREGRTDDEPRDHTEYALKVIEQLGVGALIPIGGDDTLSFALRLHEEGVPVVAIPKTMDNDVHGTDYCIGFSTAMTRTVNFVHQLRTSAGSHERLAIVEVFGRYSGETSLISAYLSGVDRTIISEVPFDVDKLGDLLLRDQAGEPEPLRDDDDLGRGDDDRRRAGRRRAGGRVRSPEAWRDRSADRGAAQGAHGPGDDLPAIGLPDAFGNAGLARSHGGDQLRGDGHRPGRSRGRSAG